MLPLIKIFCILIFKDKTCIQIGYWSGHWWLNCSDNLCYARYFLFLLVCIYIFLFWWTWLLESDVRSDLESVVIAMLDHIFSMKISEHGSNSHQDIADVFLSAATFSKTDEGCSENCMSFDDFRSWCTLVPSARKFLGSLLTPPDPGSLLFFNYLCPRQCCPV